MYESQQECDPGIAEDVHGDGRFPLSPRYWQALGDSLRLSVRELQVVQSVFEGGTEAEIADQLRLSAHTIHSYLDRLYKKLKVNSRCELAVRVFEEYLTLRAADGCEGSPSVVKFEHLA